MTDDERAEVDAIFEALREAEARDEVTALAERFAAQSSDTARARFRRVHADPPTPDEKGLYWWAEVDPAMVAAPTLAAAHVGLGVSACTSAST